MFFFLEKFVNSLNVIAFLDKIGTLVGSREAACGGHQMASPPSNTGKAQGAGGGHPPWAGVPAGCATEAGGRQEGRQWSCQSLCAKVSQGCSQTLLSECHVARALWIPLTAPTGLAGLCIASL